MVTDGHAGCPEGNTLVKTERQKDQPTHIDPQRKVHRDTEREKEVETHRDSDRETERTDREWVCVVRQRLELTLPRTRCGPDTVTGQLRHCLL